MSQRIVRLDEIEVNRTASQKASGGVKQELHQAIAAERQGMGPDDLFDFDCMESDGRIVVEEIEQAAKLEALRDSANEHGERDLRVRCHFRDESA